VLLDPVELPLVVDEPIDPSEMPQAASAAMGEAAIGQMQNTRDSSRPNIMDLSARSGDSTEPYLFTQWARLARTSTQYHLFVPFATADCIANSFGLRVCAYASRFQLPHTDGVRALSG
jgi:hypothetical protein